MLYPFELRALARDSLRFQIIQHTCEIHSVENSGNTNKIKEGSESMGAFFCYHLLPRER
jgi:hypothetical protein